MPRNAGVANICWDALVPDPHERSTRPATNQRRTVNASRPAIPSAALATLSETTGTASRLSPRVFAGLVRAAEFVLIASLGFLIAYVYVDEFFRQYVAALALSGFLAV